MIKRLWHGWTTRENAEPYERLLRNEILSGIAARKIAGHLSSELLRRDSGNEAEFLTILTFDSLDAVREFAGDDYEIAVVPGKARALLKRFDERSQHYQIKSLG
jgi:antibiotic biosynthesis monooxygenase (ABM) superfamily enzyme